MARIFLRLQVDFDDDDKVARLARFGRDARGCRDLLVAMWRYCKRNATDGHVPLEQLGRLAYPDSVKLAHRDADRLVTVGLAERTDDGYYLPSYLKRNKSAAQLAAEAEVKAEAGRKGGRRSGLLRKTEAETKQGASPEASPLLQPSEAIDIDTDIDIDKDICASESPDRNGTLTDATKRRGTRLPENWKPTENDIRWQREHGISDLLAHRQLERFANYWVAKAGRDAAKLDWSATWRNWLLKAKDDQPPQAASRPSTPWAGA